jgi:hypothetical protein
MELAAAATSGVLTTVERDELENHVRACEQCRLAFREYQILATDGFAMLAGTYDHCEADETWNEGKVRRRLFASIGAAENRDSAATVTLVVRLLMRRLTRAAALAACLAVGVGVGAWLINNRQGDRPIFAETSRKVRDAELLSAKRSADTAVAAQAARIVSLQQECSTKRLEVEKLREQFQDLQERLEQERTAGRTGLNNLAEAKAASDAELSRTLLQRNQLSDELRDFRQAYEHVEAELAAMRAERDKAILQIASVETRLGELAAIKEEQERRLRQNEQYLASDRDIRDLMSARNLYIADVFDVDSSSRTRKPFGRVFYTRGKSLLFYAFDLDRQPKLKDASTFQVWGQKETARGESARPLDLGILYLDSESNRRWVLRSDNPQRLSEIDAVFVTVEPHGGSLKPTGKPFLFAMLRKEANHP